MGPCGREKKPAETHTVTNFDPGLDCQVQQFNVGGDNSVEKKWSRIKWSSLPADHRTINNNVNLLCITVSNLRASVQCHLSFFLLTQLLSSSLSLSHCGEQAASTKSTVSLFTSSVRLEATMLMLVISLKEKWEY